MDNKGYGLEDIYQKIKDCRDCPLYKTRNNTVPGFGNPASSLMFIGEAPGASEDLKGLPFCGKAGKVLDELLFSAGLKRGYIYITNILKCRPPGNRNPSEFEIQSCTKYLEKQIEIIQPEVIACLGNFAVRFIMSLVGLEKEIKPISRIHAKRFSCFFQGREIFVIPLYHPAVAIYNVKTKPQLIKDFQLLKDTLIKD
jgi:uracil-DNA glycosylase